MADLVEERAAHVPAPDDPSAREAQRHVTTPPLTRYSVTLGRLHAELSVDEARSLWDVWPDGQRTGRRDGAFILWEVDGLGRRCCPIVYKPIRPEAS
jgi:hypothetical protein